MIDRVSGYDPATDICWQFRNKGDKFIRCKCPACSAKYPDHQLVGFGRCRSGRRWFWTASTFVNLERQEAFGWADTEAQAADAAMVAVRDIRRSCGKPVIAGMVQGYASERLKELNEAKRRARPGPDTSDTRAVEYLYGRDGCSYDGPCWCEQLTGMARWNYHIKRFQILKKTKQRIYYARQPLPFEDDEDSGIRDLTERGTAFIDRRKIEQDGEIWTRKWWSAELYLQPPTPEEAAPVPDLHRLKAEMAAAHPDHGGSNAAFIAARARYVAARRHARSTVETGRGT